MNELIDKFETTITENNGSIMVNYRHDMLTGFCEYRIVEVNNASPMVGTKKIFKQKAWILINTDMADVIEYIHSNTPLKGEDLQDVNKLIRDHSLLRVQDLHQK
jgi:hypothetical protein